MSAKINKAGKWSAQLAIVALGILFVFINIQIGLHDGTTDGISIFGLKISLFTQEAMADGVIICDITKEECEANDGTWHPEVECCYIGSGEVITCYASSKKCSWYHWDCHVFWRCQPGGTCFLDEGREPYDPSIC